MGILQWTDESVYSDEFDGSGRWFCFDSRLLVTRNHFPLKIN